MVNNPSLNSFNSTLDKVWDNHKYSTEMQLLFPRQDIYEFQMMTAMTNSWVLKHSRSR